MPYGRARIIAAEADAKVLEIQAEAKVLEIQAEAYVKVREFAAPRGAVSGGEMEKTTFRSHLS